LTKCFVHRHQGDFPIIVRVTFNDVRFQRLLLARHSHLPELASAFKDKKPRSRRIILLFKTNDKNPEKSNQIRHLRYSSFVFLVMQGVITFFITAGF